MQKKQHKTSKKKKRLAKNVVETKNYEKYTVLLQRLWVLTELCTSRRTAQTDFGSKMAEKSLLKRAEGSNKSKHVLSLMEMGRYTLQVILTHIKKSNGSKKFPQKPI